MKLTKEQIARMKDIDDDGRSLEQVLEIAMVNSANLLTELRKKKAVFWSELVDFHGLDPEKKWGIKKIDGVETLYEGVDDE